MISILGTGSSSCNLWLFWPTLYCQYPWVFSLQIRPQVQRWDLIFVDLVKQDPGRARWNSEARAGRNFTQPHTKIKSHLCTGMTDLDLFLPWESLTRWQMRACLRLGACKPSTSLWSELRRKCRRNRHKAVFNNSWRCLSAKLSAWITQQHVCRNHFLGVLGFEWPLCLRQIGHYDLLAHY